MKKLIVLFLLIVTASCIFDLGGGTHGSIKGYEYSVPKATLDKAINKIIETDTNIRRYYKADYYNDTKTYITMNIKSQEGEVEYTFRYAGDSLAWTQSSTSQIFICYVFDSKGNGGSAGDGKWEKTDPELQTKFIDLFETKFVSKVNAELNQKAVENR